jgi:hypothetical protein
VADCCSGHFSHQKRKFRTDLGITRLLRHTGWRNHGGGIDGIALAAVFISYSHDTVEHQERVLGLADRWNDGIDAEIDQHNAAPPGPLVRAVKFL